MNGIPDDWKGGVETTKVDGKTFNDDVFLNETTENVYSYGPIYLKIPLLGIL